MRKLVAVMTCHRNRVKANAQRATWVKDIREQGTADVVFFLGNPPSASLLDAGHKLGLPDEVWLDVRDDYWGIPDKVIRICQWALEHGYDYVAKCDDDVYIAPLRFAVLPLGADYIGRFRGPYGKVYPPHFASGFFYWLSARSARCIGGTPWNGDWMDERFCATVLARHNIFGYTDALNYLVTGPFTSGPDILTRKILSAGSVFCEYGPQAMLEMHAALRFAKPVSGHPGLREQPRVIVTDEILSRRPDDRPPQHKVEDAKGYLRA